MGKKFKVNSIYFQRWSKQMAYVLGYLYADGSLEDASYIRGQYIRVSSIDRETVEAIRKMLDAQHTIVSLKPVTTRSKTRYLLRIGDKKMYWSLLKLGLSPRKSHVMKFPQVPRRFLAQFILGYFDGDGCVYVSKSKGKTGKAVTKGLSVIFTSGSKVFLNSLSAELGLALARKQKIVYDSHRSFQLRYTTSDSVKLFTFLYNKPNYFLKRKAEKFMRYFQLQPKRLTPEIEKTIRKLLATW